MICLKQQLLLALACRLEKYYYVDSSRLGKTSISVDHSQETTKHKFLSISTTVPSGQHVKRLVVEQEVFGCEAGLQLAQVERRGRDRDCYIYL